MLPVSLSAEAVALMWSPALPQCLIAMVACSNTPESPQPDLNHLTDMTVIGTMAPKVSHVCTPAELFGMTLQGLSISIPSLLLSRG